MTAAAAVGLWDARKLLSPMRAAARLHATGYDTNHDASIASDLSGPRVTYSTVGMPRRSIRRDPIRVTCRAGACLYFTKGHPAC